MSYGNNQRIDADNQFANVPKSLFVDGRESKDQVSQVLNERGKRYGDFSDHANVCQQLKDVMMHSKASRYAALTADKKQALDVIADKIARILTGDPEYDDNWIDIQGYAKLAQERLRKPEAAAQAGGQVGAEAGVFRGTLNLEKNLHR